MRCCRHFGRRNRRRTCRDPGQAFEKRPQSRWSFPLLDLGSCRRGEQIASFEEHVGQRDGERDALFTEQIAQLFQPVRQARHVRHLEHPGASFDGVQGTEKRVHDVRIGARCRRGGLQAKQFLFHQL